MKVIDLYRLEILFSFRKCSPCLRLTKAAYLVVCTLFAVPRPRLTTTRADSRLPSSIFVRRGNQV